MITGGCRFYGDTESIFGSDPGTSFAEFRRFIHPDDVESTEQALADAAANHRNYDGEFRVVHPGGAIRWTHGQGQFSYRQGKPVRMVGVNADVTDGKVRERELSEAKDNLESQTALLEATAENIPIMLCYMREPGKVHWVNRTWEDTLGWTPDDNGGNLTPLLYPDPHDAARVRDFFGRGGAEWAEFSPRTKSGRSIDVEFMNLKLPDGTIIGMGRDLTVQNRTIHELIESGRRFRMLSENVPQIVWIADGQGRTHYYNQRWYEFSGQTPSQAREHGWRLVVHPEDLEPNQQRWEEAIRTGSNYESELRLRRHDGVFRWFLVRALQIRDAKGQPARWFGTSTDITEHKANQARLEQSEARYRTLVEATAQIVWTANGTGTKFGSLGGWEAFTGQAAEEAQNGGWVAVVHPEDAAATLDAWNHAIATRSVFQHEHRIRRRDGIYRLMISRAVPVIDRAGNLVEWIGTNSDVTEQKLAQEALIRAEKLSTAGRFAATVAHEVYNPLTAVTNIHYILAADPNVPEQVRAYLSLADSELQRVSHILRQTLAFYREHSRQQEVRLAAVVEEVVAIFRHRLQSRGIALDTRICQDLTLFTMGGELRQILCNLIANALDASSKGGRIWVRAHRRSGECEAIRIVVADAGTGIAPENQERLFEPFFTTKESLGTGLGLWVTRQLAERNGARIRVRSRVGAGTLFAMEFPLVPPETSHQPARAVEATEAKSLELQSSMDHSEMYSAPPSQAVSTRDATFG
jgi:PAS domain S-box-containing protein